MLGRGRPTLKFEAILVGAGRRRGEIPSTAVGVASLSIASAKVADTPRVVKRADGTGKSELPRRYAEAMGIHFVGSCWHDGESLGRSPEQERISDGVSTR